MGCGILATYPQVAALVGVQGLIVYGLASSLPIMMFAFLGPAIRKRCPGGFIVTQWVEQRYGLIASLYLSACMILTMFLYMVGELTSVQLAIQSLTGLDALPCLIVECVVVCLYTSVGGFTTSFFTDNIQGFLVLILLIICTVSMGVYSRVDTSLIGPSGLLKGTPLGYKLIYILLMAIITNDVFLSGFWIRTFASKTDKDLFIGCSIATVVILIFLVLTGVTGLLAAWSGLYPSAGNEDGSASFYLVLLQMPAWVVGFVIVFIVVLSTATFDSLVSAMTTTLSTDLLRNKVPIMWVRLMVLVMMAPSIVVALKGPNILQIWLITDLLSAAVVPVLFLGLWTRLWFITGWEVIVSGLGGILTVFIFGAIYFDSASLGGQLLLLEEGLYVDDWSVFGAFVAAPFGGLVWGVIGLVVRICFMWVFCKITGREYTSLTRPENVIAPFGNPKTAHDLASDTDSAVSTAVDAEGDIDRTSVEAGAKD